MPIDIRPPCSLHTDVDFSALLSSLESELLDSRSAGRKRTLSSAQDADEPGLRDHIQARQALWLHLFRGLCLLFFSQSVFRFRHR